ncbi:MAG: hypothetical protein AB8B87_17190 [Granulosicoccus sp.]
MTVIFSRFCNRPRLDRWLIGIILLLACSGVQAQNSAPDTSAPIIELEELVQSVASSTQVFTVQIAEETELQEATLYHRRSGEQSYKEAPMIPLGTTGFYTASIPTDPEDLRSIEYYVQARDTSDNRTVSGFSFDPFSRRLTPDTAERIQQRQEAVPEEVEEIAPVPTITTATPFYKRRWFQVTLGVIAVGALASTLSEDGEDTRLVPVTFTFE